MSNITGASSGHVQSREDLSTDEGEGVALLSGHSNNSDGEDREVNGHRRKDSTGSIKKRKGKARQSNWMFIKEMLYETLPTLSLSTIGLTLTGELVEVVANWQSMSRVDELFILIPVLNNMKGNLEMNLSSRLSTAAYMGALDTASSRKVIITGNLILLQIQALGVSALAGIMAFTLALVAPDPDDSGKRSVVQLARRHMQLRKTGAGHSKPIPNHNSRPGFHELNFVLATAMSAAALSAGSLGSFMCSLIVICRRLGINPDNVAPPIASALGDLLTLTILSLVSTLFLPILSTIFPLVIIIVLLTFLVFCVLWPARRNEHLVEAGLVRKGWWPLVAAMVITSASGLVLDRFVDKYEGYGLLAIVISGLPGGVGSVFVSRISTALHAAATSDKPTSLTSAVNGNPEAHTDHDSRLYLVAGTLFTVTLPVQILFLLFLHLSGWIHLQWIFVGIFSLGFFISVFSSLTIANFLTHYLWKKGMDPDMYAMPIQSSLVDLIGQCLLVGSYELSALLGGSMKLSAARGAV